MHLFSFENDEDRECVNKCKIYSLILVDSLFCPMTRLTTQFFAEKWRAIPKTGEFRLVIVNLF